MSSFVLMLFKNFGCFFLLAFSTQLVIFLVVLSSLFGEYLLLGLFLEPVSDSEHCEKLQKLLLWHCSQYIKSMSDQSDISSPPKQSPKSPIAPQKPIGNDREIELLEQNKNLRKKLKQLSARLDDELQRAAKNKLKANINHVQASSPESQSLQLQNAYKMIERLQKTVKDFESKQSYQISFKRILDLESIIKKKETESEELKGQLKDSKKTIRDKEKHISDLIDKQAVNPNLNEEKQTINKLKQLVKRVQNENEELKKRQLEKHKKLVTAERKLVEIEQEEQQPIGRQQELLDKLEQYRSKYKEAMMRIEKQNAYITKLNTRISTLEDSTAHKRVRSHHTSQQKKQISRSMEDLPDLPNNKIKPTILDHIPSLNLPAKMLRRY